MLYGALSLQLICCFVAIFIGNYTYLSAHPKALSLQPLTHGNTSSVSEVARCASSYLEPNKQKPRYVIKIKIRYMRIYPDINIHIIHHSSFPSLSQRGKRPRQPCRLQFKFYIIKTGKKLIASSAPRNIKKKKCRETLKKKFTRSMRENGQGKYLYL